MNRVLIITSLLILFITTGPCLAEEERTITIGTFNIQGLGEHPDPVRIDHLAKICKGIDLLAIQEVHPNGSEAVASLARAMGEEFQSAVSDETTWERFAFIWRSPVEMKSEPKLLEKPALGRKPYFAAFKAGNFDFELMNLHLFFDGSKKTYPHTRMVEFKLLDDWLSYRQDTELDLILVGDFNAPGPDYGYQFPAPLTSGYFFYEMLNRHGLKSVSIDKETPTSIMNRNIYDHLIFNPDRYFVSEYAGNTSAEVICWDRHWDTNANGVLDWDEYEIARKSVSDHRIVTARFKIDLEDDDDVPEMNDVKKNSDAGKSPSGL